MDYLRRNQHGKNRSTHDQDLLPESGGDKDLLAETGEGIDVQLLPVKDLRVGMRKKEELEAKEFTRAFLKTIENERGEHDLHADNRAFDADESPGGGGIRAGRSDDDSDNDINPLPVLPTSSVGQDEEWLLLIKEAPKAALQYLKGLSERIQDQPERYTSGCFLRGEMQLFARDGFGNNALHICCLNDRVEVLMVLLDLNISALHSATRKTQSKMRKMTRKKKKRTGLSQWLVARGESRCGAL